MDKNLHEFIELLNKAINVAKVKLELIQKESSNKDLLEMAELTVKNLQDWRDIAVAGKLPRPSHGAGLGLSKHIGEWCNDELYELALDLDEYYQKKM